MSSDGFNQFKGDVNTDRIKIINNLLLLIIFHPTLWTKGGFFIDF
jgi:hypothetical protein